MKNAKRIPVIFFAAFTIAIGFQNCGQMSASSEMSSEELNDPMTLTDIGYPYALKPAFYHSVALYKLGTQVERLSEFKFFGTLAAYADVAEINYEVRIRNESGVLICPTRSGTLRAGNSAIEFDCVSGTVAQEARIEIKAKAGDVEATIEERI